MAAFVPKPVRVLVLWMGKSKFPPNKDQYLLKREDDGNLCYVDADKADGGQAFQKGDKVLIPAENMAGWRWKADPKAQNAAPTVVPANTVQAIPEKIPQTALVVPPPAPMPAMPAKPVKVDENDLQEWLDQEHAQAMAALAKPVVVAQKRLPATSLYMLDDEQLKQEQFLEIQEERPNLARVGQIDNILEGRKTQKLLAAILTELLKGDK